MATTNIQSFSGDVEVSGALTVTGQLNSTTGSDKVKLTATTSDETDYIPLSKGVTGAQALYTDSSLTYNPSNNVIAANLSGNVSGNVTGNVTGNLTGNADSATNAGYAANAGAASTATFATSATHANAANTVAFTARNATDNTDYIAFVDTATAGDKALYTDSSLTYNPSNNVIAANLSGDVSGNVTGNVTGNLTGNADSATNAGYAANAGAASTATFATTSTNSTHANAANTVAFTARNATNNTDYIAFVDTATAGDKALFTDSNLTYNSSTNHINANVPYANAAGSATNATSAGSATNASYAVNATFANVSTNATYANNTAILNGYEFYDNGLGYSRIGSQGAHKYLINWGATGNIGTGQSAYASYRAGFGACYSVIATRIQSSGANSFAWSVGQISNSGFRVYSNGAVTGQYYWIAVGR